MLPTLSITEFLQLYYKLRNVDKTIRMGQFFINLCVKDSSSAFMQQLWNELHTERAKYDILAYMYDLQMEHIVVVDTKFLHSVLELVD